MAQSIKKRVNAAHLGVLTDKELKKLFDAALVDLAAIRAQVNVLAADHANLQVVTNNIISGVDNLNVAVCNLRLAVTNIDVNCTNAIVNLNAVTLNLNAATLAGVSNMSALTLTA